MTQLSADVYCGDRRIGKIRIMVSDDWTSKRDRRRAIGRQLGREIALMIETLPKAEREVRSIAK